MHAVNSIWVGKTFALAKGNESAGRKSRIRRSKEERKGMVESFIKKYQHLNNGNFPSLNLTHKEVGGSFYTVREIVREVIQENRVLGPAKFWPEEQSIDLLLEQYPVGTISTEPQTVLSTFTNGSPFGADHPEHTREEELDLVCADPEQQGFDNREFFNGNHVPSGISIAHDQHEESPLVCAESEQFELGNRKVINGGSHALVNNEESDGAKIGEDQGRESIETEEESVEAAQSSELKAVDVQANEVVETEKSVEAVTASKRPTIVDVQASKPLEADKSIDRVTAQGRVSQMADVVVETFPLRNLGEARYSNGNSARKDVEKAHSGAGNGTSSPDGVVISKTSSLMSSSTVTNGGIMRDVDMKQNEVENSPNGRISDPKSTVPEDGVGKKTEIQKSRDRQKARNHPTLNRIDLKSWEGNRRRPSELETNPLLVFFKSFISAFVKFWSE